MSAVNVATRVGGTGATRVKAWTFRAFVGAAVFALALVFAHGSLSTSHLTLVALVGIAAVLTLTRERPIAALRYLPWLIVFIAIAIASLTWSEAPAESLRALAIVVFELVIGLWLGRLGGISNPRASMVAVQLGYIAIAVASLLMGLRDPSLGLRSSDGGWHGISSTKNELGIFVAWALIHAVNVFSPRVRIAVGVPLVFLLILTRADTSILAVCLALLFEVLASVAYRRGRKSETGASRVMRRTVFLLLAIFAAAGLWAALDHVVELFGKNMTFSRRTDIWSVLLSSAPQNKIHGDGFAAQLYTGSPLQIAIQNVAGPTVHTAHNGFIPIYLGLGWIGVIVFALAIVGIVMLADRSLGTGDIALRQSGLFLLGSVVLYLVQAVGEDVTLSRAGLLCLLIAVGRLTVDLDRVRRDSQAPTARGDIGLRKEANRGH